MMKRARMVCKADIRYSSPVRQSARALWCMAVDDDACEQRSTFSGVLLKRVHPVQVEETTLVPFVVFVD